MILGNFLSGENTDTFHIADHFFHMKKSVNLRKDNAKDHYTRIILLYELRVTGEIYKQPGAKSSLLCCGTEKSWIFCLRVIPGVWDSQFWRKQMGVGGAPYPKSVSPLVLSCMAKAFFKIWNLAPRKGGIWGLRRALSSSGCGWKPLREHFPGDNPLLARAPALAACGNSPNNGRWHFGPDVSWTSS